MTIPRERDDAFVHVPLAAARSLIARALSEDERQKAPPPPARQDASGEEREPRTTSVTYAPASPRTAIPRTAIPRTARDPAPAPGPLGTVSLRPHQRSAVARLRAALHMHHGALLADEVGLGKTYVAIAVASEYERTCVVAPAALLPMWRAALAHAGRSARLLSYEALSRLDGDAALEPLPDMVVLDEAHHVRTSRTHRYRRIAQLAARAHVLLVSATPIHNRRAELESLLALFLGERAHALSDEQVAQLVVRREREDVALREPLPAVEAVRWLDTGDDTPLLPALLALPPPVPPAGGGDAGALVALSLVRQWASSRAALGAALRRRLARALALQSALECGRHPTRAELGAWCTDGDAQQLAFPEIVVDRAMPECRANAGSLAAAVSAHADAVRVLLHHLEHGSGMDPDLARAAALRTLRERHPGERIIAFSEYAETVLALWRALRRSPGVAALTAHGAIIAGGAVTRSEALARFAPLGSGTREPAARERIELLLTTDLLSEGVNLQDASVLVHLDLPWSPARLEQRVGRLRRMGSPHDRIHVYALRPPAPADVLLRAERRLRDKLRIAQRTLGVAGVIPFLLPLRVENAPPAPSSPAAPARAYELLLRILDAWRDDAAASPGGTSAGASPVLALGVADRSALLAVLEADDGHRLMVGAVGGGRVSVQPSVVLDAARLVAGARDERRARRDGAFQRALAEVVAWADGFRAERHAGVTEVMRASARRDVLRRIAQVMTRVPPHARPRLAALASRARAVVTSPFGIAAERMLAELARAPTSGEAWLRAVVAFGDANVRRVSTNACAASWRVAVLVLIEESDRSR
ncbi:MAG TPA: helicase-related protein [Gemmatimonadaceae bacterium]|nr:helicase-related protein [Gemmatimonadaceae bacterium]